MINNNEKKPYYDLRWNELFQQINFPNYMDIHNYRFQLQFLK